MRSHERTLLASLGFADPDKREARHDAACRFLSQPHIASRVVSALLFDEEVHDQHQGGPTGWFDARIGKYSRSLQSVKSAMEVPLSKGAGQYKTTIGFQDVYYRATIAQAFTGKERQSYSAPWENVEGRDAGAGILSISIEVKINRIGIGDVLRQVNLYREYSEAVFLVATAWQDQTLTKELKDNRVKHITLGSEFEKFERTRTIYIGDDAPKTIEL